MTFSALFRKEPITKYMQFGEYRDTIQINHGQNDWWGDSQKVGDKVDFYNSSNQLKTGTIVSITSNAAFIQTSGLSMADKIPFGDITYNYRLSIRKAEYSKENNMTNEQVKKSSYSTILKGGVGSGRHAYSGNPITDTVKRKSFGEVPIGGHFHTGKAKGAGINSDKDQMTVYHKISPSKAIIGNRIGFGNTSMEGADIGFNHSQPVFHFSK